MTLTHVGVTPPLLPALPPLSPAEAAAWNAGVTAVLTIAERTCAALARDPRHLPVGFAQVVLAELAEAGRALLLPTKPTKEAAANGGQ